MSCTCRETGSTRAQRGREKEKTQAGERGIALQSRAWQAYLNISRTCWPQRRSSQEVRLPHFGSVLPPFFSFLRPRFFFSTCPVPSCAGAGVLEQGDKGGRGWGGRPVPPDSRLHPRRKRHCGHPGRKPKTHRWRRAASILRATARKVLQDSEAAAGHVPSRELSVLNSSAASTRQPHSDRTESSGGSRRNSNGSRRPGGRRRMCPRLSEWAAGGRGRTGALAPSTLGWAEERR